MQCLHLISNQKNDYYKTFITQEMLKKNILTSNTVYCCIDHEKFLKTYFKELEVLFKKIRYFEGLWKYN